MRDDLVIGMAGSGGDGIVSAGESLIAAAAASGYYAMLTKSFGPQIRGGESSCRLRMSSRPVFNPGGSLDVAVALDWDDFLRFGAELPIGEGTIVIYDAASGVAPDRLPLGGVSPAETLAIPIGEIARTTAGVDRAKNIVVLGLLAGWFGIDGDAIRHGIRIRFGKKGHQLLAASERAFEAGVSHATAQPLRTGGRLAPAAGGAKLLADGNDM
jgi:2-oxoglutarate ferredoxin oxidoreductase subunit alpha